MNEGPGEKKKKEKKSRLFEDQQWNPTARMASGGYLKRKLNVQKKCPLRTISRQSFNAKKRKLMIDKVSSIILDILNENR